MLGVGGGHRQADVDEQGCCNEAVAVAAGQSIVVACCFFRDVSHDASQQERLREGESGQAETGDHSSQRRP